MDQNVDNVIVTKMASASGTIRDVPEESNTGKYPISRHPINIRVEFKNNEYRESQLDGYIQRNFKYNSWNCLIIKLKNSEIPNADNDDTSNG